MTDDKNDLIYMLSCYLEKRREKPHGDASRAIVALYEMETGHEATAEHASHRMLEREDWPGDEHPAIPDAKPRFEQEQEPHRCVEDARGIRQEPRPSGPREKRVDYVEVPINVHSPMEPEILGQGAAPEEEYENLEVTRRSGARRRRTGGPRQSPHPQPVSEDEIEGHKAHKNHCDGCGLTLRKGDAGSCNSCDASICPSCGQHPQMHKDSPVFFDYKFDFPLCKDCYLSAFTTQEEMGRASTYFRTGNFTYASRHATHALEIAESWPGGVLYAENARNLLDSIEGARPRADKMPRAHTSGMKRSDTLDDIKGDKWTKKFVERALARREA